MSGSRPDTEGIDVVPALSLKGHVATMVFRPRIVHFSSLANLTRDLRRDGLDPWWISSEFKDWPGVKWVCCPFESEDDTGTEANSMHVFRQSRFAHKLYASWVQQLRLVFVPDSVSQLPLKRARVRRIRIVRSEDSKR